MSKTVKDADGGGVPLPGAHLLLAAVTLLPLLTNKSWVLPTDVNIVTTAALCVYVGCWRSVKPLPPDQSMSRKDAMKFPLIGSAVLVSLFVLFKYLPKDLINAVLTTYFVLLGTFAITATLLPFIEPLFPKRVQQRSYEFKKLQIPYLLQEPVDIAATVPEMVGGACSLAFCCWYYAKKHWLANNLLGIAFSIQGIEHLSLGAVSTGVILLSGLFVYDIFWVFCTPVMVTVAKSFDAPIKLLFPRVLSGKGTPFSMLGLGDIVIPGIFVALLLRYDVKHAKPKSAYFLSAFWGYVGGLGATIAVMNVFQAAQPALLYIVPAVLLAVGVHAQLRGEFRKVLDHSEDVNDAKKEAKSVREEIVSVSAALAGGVPSSKHD